MSATKNNQPLSVMWVTKPLPVWLGIGVVLMLGGKLIVTCVAVDLNKIDVVVSN